MRRTKEASKYKLVEDLIYGLNQILTTITIEHFYQFKHYPDDNKKSQWKKAASKEITMKEFQLGIHLQEKRF